MWWADAERRLLSVVLRADSLEAGWMPPGKAACATSLGQPIEAAPSAGDISGSRIAVTSALQALRSSVVQAQQEQRGPALHSTVVALLAGPCVAALALPWNDEFLQTDRARTHALQELRARGFDASADDLLAIDHRPGLGRPRPVFWVPQWLDMELKALAAAVQGRLRCVQSLNIAAAGWLRRRSRRLSLPNVQLALFGSGALQLLPVRQRDGALGERLAEAAIGGPAERVEALWHRAGVRLPALTGASTLNVLCLDEAPPAAGGAAGLQWVPWPETSRAALDRCVAKAACGLRAVDVAPRPATGVALLQPIAAAACVAGATAFTLAGWQQRQAHVHIQQVPETTVPAAPSISAAGLAEMRAVNAAVRQLNLHLPALLRVLKPPRDVSVNVVSLDLAGRGDTSDSESGDAMAIKVSAQAPSAVDMTRYALHLGAQPGVTAAQMLRHEADQAAADGAYRFDIELTWRQ